MPLAAHCPRCGAAVSRTGPSSGRCTGCGREVYANSKPTAGVLLVRDERVLLIRRGAEPYVGRWDIPGGYLEEGEPPEAGAVREIAEELGLRLDPRTLELCLCSINPWPEGDVLDLVFEAPAPAEPIRLGSDAADFGWFELDGLPEDLAFESTRAVLERWRSRRIGRDYARAGSDPVRPYAAPILAQLRPEDCTDGVRDGWSIDGPWSLEDGALILRASSGLASVRTSAVSGVSTVILRGVFEGPARIQVHWGGLRALFDAPDGRVSLGRQDARAGARAIVGPLVDGRGVEFVLARIDDTWCTFIDGRPVLEWTEVRAKADSDSFLVGVTGGTLQIDTIELRGESD